MACLIAAAALALHAPCAAPRLSSWGEWYAWRQLPPDSPLALLLSWPLTVWSVLDRLGLALPASPPRRVVVHYLGPEKEVMMLPLWAELARLLPSVELAIHMVGPLGIALPAVPMVFEGRCGGAVTLAVHRGLYHAAVDELPPADVAIALNAGLAIEGYADRWPQVTGLQLHPDRT